MANQVAVLGMGRFGVSLSRELYRIGHDVLIVDRDESLTQSMMGAVTYAVTGDSTSMEFLEEIGIRNFDYAVVAIGTDIQSSVLTTVLLKSTFRIPTVVARATNELHGKTLEAIGADRVVFPEQETGLRTARNLFQAAMLDHMELTSDFGFTKINVPPSMVGATLEQAGLSTSRDRYGAAVIAIRRGREPILSPSKDEPLRAGDQLIVAGPEGSLARLSSQ